MHPQSTAAHLTELPVGSLVLERLPSGELAWLEPEVERIWLTDLGRRALAHEALFGDHWPTAAEVSAAVSPADRGGGPRCARQLPVRGRGRRRGVMSMVTISAVMDVLAGLLVAISPLAGVLVACGLCAALGLAVTEFTSYLVFGLCVPGTVVLAVLGASRLD